MDSFRIRPIEEPDVDEIVVVAGGRRLHADADRRRDKGADYLLGDSIIELKLLDDEGLAKPERQRKLADLFKSQFSGRPVIVLDRESLTPEGARKYDRILEGPVKTAVSSARAQLKQSRLETPGAKVNLLWVINNGYTALDDEALRKLVVHRARNDSSEIDGVIVSGCYFHSDTFDSFFLWPIHYEPINLDRVFSEFETLKDAWDNFAQGQMTELIRRPSNERSLKGPVVDTQFDIDGITFVKSAPPLGKTSDFFVAGRPRKNSGGNEYCPPIAKVFADISSDEWIRFAELDSAQEDFGASYGDWVRKRDEAIKAGSVQLPTVPVQISFDGWSNWKNNRAMSASNSVHRYANDLFEVSIRRILESTRNFDQSVVRPRRYIVVLTEEIGQDRANDVSHAAIATELEREDTQHVEIFSEQRIVHEHAIALACSYALIHGIDVVMWRKDLRYAWI